jgi:hypothetical protein
MRELGTMERANQLYRHSLASLCPKLAYLNDPKDYPADNGQRAKDFGDVRERCQVCHTALVRLDGQGLSDWPLSSRRDKVYHERPTPGNRVHASGSFVLSVRPSASADLRTARYSRSILARPAAAPIRRPPPIRSREMQKRGAADAR